MKGYISKFIGDHLEVSFPELNASQKADMAPCSDNPQCEYKYEHHSLFLSKSRRFPFFTATNINGSLFKKIKRTEVFPSGRDEWRIDERGKEYQLGHHLYEAVKSNFQRGHMTKREDPQWGISLDIARSAAQSTFYFSNCVPQVAELNTKEWGFLETYILNKEAVPSKMMVNVFTGPVLSADDPIFVTKVEGTDIQIPTLFWKVVYFTNDGKTLSKVGFLMGQENLLVEKGIVKEHSLPRLLRTITPEKDHFLDFEDAKTFQVNLSTIEKLSGLMFPKAREPYTDLRPVKLVLKEIELEVKKWSLSRIFRRMKTRREYRYEGLVV